jgi:peptidyl-prolyl cis-trans isomerase SurA
MGYDVGAMQQGVREFDVSMKVATAQIRARRMFAGLVFAITVGIVPLLPAPAAAQQVVALVNGEPITALDVAQRLKLHQISARRSPPRQELIEELINEKIKIQQAARLGIIIPDSDVDRLLGQMAQSAGRKPVDFTAELTKSGIDVPRFKNRIRAESAWRQVMQQQSPASFMVRDADIVALLMSRGQTAQISATQYSLRQIVFVVPRGSSDTVRATRVREAEAFRKTFTNCQDGFAIARQQRDVVVKDPVMRLSSDLNTRLRELLDKTPIGALTPPEPIPGGIEVVAVCDRKETIADVSSRREVREELLGKRIQLGDKELLDKFRARSIIEYRNTAEPRP